MTSWEIGPFTRRGEVLDRQPDLPWAAKDVFNPAAVVRDGRVHLLIRGEDTVGPYSGTSRIGLATSEDGLHFEVEPEPVLYPFQDEWHPWDWPGGCEDPRVVESPEGGYVCAYTAFDGKTACLFVATSDDLRTWVKHGPAFAGTPYVRRWSKSGSVVTELVDGRLVAARFEQLHGCFVMYWGEGTCFAATSDDLVHWQPVQFDAGADRFLSYRTESASWSVHRVPGTEVLRPLLFPRPGRFDSLLVEPGPPAIRTADGVVLIYNGASFTEAGVAYRPAQVLFDAGDPLSPIARSTSPCLESDNLGGQVANVCFAQGLVLFNGAWHLYFGMGDSRIGLATAPA
ncbi:MAG TPA: glycoside hydrolase family 130 protein [Acidimicrobiales bacterium]|nr:glycoside hydrolase family 130 protein [Acidimicrobiales bacterium]